MTAINIVIQLTIPVALLVLPLLCYRKKGPRALAFYVSMSIEPKKRKAFMLAMAMTVILFNFSFFSREGASFWQVPGFILGLVLLRYPSTDAILHWLNSDRMLLGLAFALTLLTLIEPRLYSLSASMALVLTCSMIYPSRDIIRHAQNPGPAEPGLHLSNEDIVKLYFTMPRARVVRHSEAHGCRKMSGTSSTKNKQSE